MKPERPFGVTILAVWVLIIAVLFLTRFAQTIQQWRFITERELASPGYLLATGLFFGLAGLPVLWGLWFGKNWSVRWVQAYFIALVFFYWIDRLFFVAAEAAQVNWPFALVFTLLMLAWVFWELGRPMARHFFQSETANRED